MKRIRKYCNSLRMAEEYQDELYDLYDSVTLVHSPLTSEAGEYVWEVKV